MKNRIWLAIQYLIGIFILLGFTTNSHAQIAKNYPNDSLIQNDPNVIFAEMFEYNSVSEMISAGNYLTSQMLSHISLNNSVPPGSKGSYSLKLTTVENSDLSNDPNEDANILKKFAAGINDSVFVRYYVKYNSAHTFHHSGVWLGGTNPANGCWPCNYPGRIIPTNGDSAFVVGTEVRGLATQSAQLNSRFGFYNYWMDMNPFVTGPNAGKFYGNEFVSPNSLSNLSLDSWNCIEVMLKLNNPVSDSTGELKLWINGTLVAHYGKGFPNGTWNEAIFIEGSGTPFKGFRWRKNQSVVFNYIWIKNYSTANNPYPSNNDILFDHIVVARDYIGPIFDSGLSNILESPLNSKVNVYPNPANTILNFSIKSKIVKLYNILGKQVFEGNNTTSIFTGEIPEGIYTLYLDYHFYKIVVKH